MSASWGVKKKNRNYIEIWILLLLLFSTNFFDLVPITRIIGPNGPFTFYLLSLFFMFTFNRRAWIRDSLDWLTPMWWILGGVILSFIPSLLYYGQSFVQSFFTNRKMLELIAFPILIALRPSEKEMRKALYAFSVIYLIVSLFVTFFAQGWIPVRDDSTSFLEEGDYIYALSGVRHIALAFIFALHHATKDTRTNNILWVLYELFLLYLIQNRTSLIAVFFIVAFAIYRMKTSSRKLIIVTVLILVFILLAVATSGQWGRLYQMTVQQISDPDYNRNKAFTYMFSSRYLLQYLFGSGYISANVNPIVQVLRESGIYHSDVGLIGLWHQYGVIPAVVVLVVAFKGLFGQKSLLVKASSIYILVGIPTLSFFAFGETLLWLSMYLYILNSDGAATFVDDSVRRTKVGWGRNVYRSIAR